MFCRAFISSFVIILITVSISSAQSGIREKRITSIKDTVTLDTVSIVPGSVKLKYLDGRPVAEQVYHIDYAHALLIWKKSLHRQKLLLLTAFFLYYSHENMRTKTRN